MTGEGLNTYLWVEHPCKQNQTACPTAYPSYLKYLGCLWIEGFEFTCLWVEVCFWDPTRLEGFKDLATSELKMPLQTETPYQTVG